MVMEFYAIGRYQPENEYTNDERVQKRRAADTTKVSARGSPHYLFHVGQETISHE